MKKFTKPFIIIACIAIASAFNPSNAQTWMQKGDTIYGKAIEDRSGDAVAISANGNIMAIGSPKNDDNLSNAGKVRIYEWDASASNWIQKGVDIDGTFLGGEFGNAISLSADGLSIAIGAHKAEALPPLLPSPGFGHTSVFQWNGTAWSPKGDTLSGTTTLNLFGSTVSLSGDGNTLAVGTPHSSNSGVSVYEYDGTNWLPKGAAFPSSNQFHRFGTSVDLNYAGTALIIGATSTDIPTQDVGHAEVHYYNGTAWTQIGVNIVGEATLDKSGHKVSIDTAGTTIAVSSINNDDGGTDAGHVRVYELNTSFQWTQKGADIDGATIGEKSGTAIDLSADGNSLVIGANLNNISGTEAGLVKVYDYISNQWTLRGSAIAGQAANNRFGTAVALSADGLTFCASGPRTSEVPVDNKGATRAFYFCPTLTGAHTETICYGQSVVINGTTYSAATQLTGTETFQVGPNNCDSIVNVTITELPQITGTHTATICDGDSIVVNGTSYKTATTTATETFTVGPNNCDSIVTINLTVNTLPTVSIAAFSPDSVCSTDAAFSLPIGTPTGGTYTGNGVGGGNFDPAVATVGDYFVKYEYTDANSCTSTDSTLIVVKLCTGIDEGFNSKGISIFPNPTNNFITLDLEKINAPVNISLTAIDGKVLYQKNNVNQNSYTMDLNNKPAGIYFIHIENNEHYSFYKIIKE